MPVYPYQPKVQTKFHRFIDEATDLAPTTKTQYLRALDKFCEYCVQRNISPEMCSAGAVEHYYQQLLIVHRHRPATANKQFNAVRYVLRKQALLDPSRPRLDRVVELAPETTDHQAIALTASDVHRMLTTCVAGPQPAGLRDAVLLIVALETGLRRNGLASMCWSKIALHEGQAAIDVPIKGKHGLGRHKVPLSATAEVALAAWRHWCQTKHQFRDPIFRRILDDGALGETALTEQSIYEAIKKRAAAVGLEAYPQTLRYTFVTWRSLAGVPEGAIKAVTGHKDMLAWDPHDVVRAYPCLKATPAWLAAFAERLHSLV